METTNNKKMSLTLAAMALGALMAGPFVLPEKLWQPAMENDLIRSIKSRLALYTDKTAEEKLYLQVDKPLYQPGDDIWIAAYLCNASNLQPSKKSDIIHVELISPKGTIEQSLNLIAEKGRAAGDFKLDPSIAGGLYKLRAYTNWMKNSGEENYFEKEFQVQTVLLPNLKMKLDFEREAYGAGDVVNATIHFQSNENRDLVKQPVEYQVSVKGEKFHTAKLTTDEEGKAYVRFELPAKLESNDVLLNVLTNYNNGRESISRSVPVVLNNISLSLFPEGGDLLNGVENNIAFKACNEFGKPADIEGVVLTKKGSRILSFSSFHQGMGSFRLQPQPGESYFVKITKPAGIKDEFPLPDAWDKGYAMSVDNSSGNDVKVSVQSTEDEELSLLAQVRGKVYYSTVINAKPGSNHFSFDSKHFPIGIAQLTLFDSRGIERCERLVFVNKQKQMNISIQTNKDKYQPREKVIMTVTVKDEKGLPMPACLSMAVVNDQLLSFADSKDGNLLSTLLLQTELNCKVEEPSFYFDPKEKKADRALDYLLLTSGWRRFTWEKMLNEEPPAEIYQSEKAILGGTVIDGNTGLAIKGAQLKEGAKIVASTDENGNFFMDRVKLYEPLQVSLDLPGYYPASYSFQNYGQGQSIYLYPVIKHTKVRSEAKKNEMEFEDVQLVPAAASGAARVFAVEMQAMAKDMQAVNLSPTIHPGFDLGKAEVLVEMQVVDDKRFKFIAMDEDMVEQKAPVQVYHRARQFPQANYASAKVPDKRSDFRNTIYWDPNLEIGHSGKKVIEFYASDDITSFRATAEGISSAGDPGRTEKTFFTQLPFLLKIKMPAQLLAGDQVKVPLTLYNNTNEPIGGVLQVSNTGGLQSTSSLAVEQILMPGQVKTILLPYNVIESQGEQQFSASFKACGFSDAFSQTFKVESKGFPAEYSFSSQELNKQVSFDLNQQVKGSLRIAFSAYPNVVSDLVKGVEGILQEPYGCFEQTSCTAYPNAMVLDYLKHTGSKDTKLLSRAEALLDRGYKRLTTFETSTKGYEWFGANPAHEGLTAYGIMEFTDMKKAGQKVDEQMLQRTAAWLLSHRDGKGGFEREQRALHDFGRISADVLNGYIVYALADAGYTEIKNEFESAYTTAIKTNDPYLLAMNANAAISLKDSKKKQELIKRLLTKQENDGSFNGSTHSITYSQGKSLIIETTALAIIAMINSHDCSEANIQKAVQYLVSARDGSGTFSSTQGTILALKALTEYAKHSKATAEGGKIRIYVDGKMLSEKAYKAGEKETILINDFEKLVLNDGTHKVRIEFTDTRQALPYSLSIKYNTNLPSGSAACKIDLKAGYAAKQIKLGETLRLKLQLQNKSDQEVPSTIAIIGIPAGLSVQPWQLKELQEKNVFDYYEIKGNSIALYYRGLGPACSKEINLDLKAEIAGTFEAPASSAYLYYTNEHKTWVGTGNISVIN